MRNEILNNEILFMDGCALGRLRNMIWEMFGMLISEDSKDSCHR